MQRKITLLDGAVGTSLYAKAAAHGIEEHDPVWVFNLRYPDLVQELCRDYHDAGSTYIMANTFTANRQSVSHFSNYAVADVVTAGVQLARDALQGTGAKVGLAVGALAQLMKPFGPRSLPRLPPSSGSRSSPASRPGQTIFCCRPSSTFP